MTKARLPAGIYERIWKNKRTRQTETRYQVRINRKDMKVSKFFDTEKEARDYLSDMLSPAGRKVREAEVAAAREKMVQWVHNKIGHKLHKTLEQCLDAYLDHISPSPEALAAMNTTQRNTANARRSRVNALKAVEIDWVPQEHRKRVVMFPNFRNRVLQRVRFVGLKMEDLDEDAARAFIDERCKLVSANTIKRDLGFLGGMFNELAEFDSFTAKQIQRNPFKGISLKRLRNAQPTTRTKASRLTLEQEEKLFEVLKGAKTRGFQESSTMLHITALALETGMRRGEILELEWSRVYANEILLRETDTKTGEARSVRLTPAAAAILADVPRREGQDKVFSYTPSGFATNWDRCRRKAGLPNLSFHQLRHEFITRTLNALSGDVPAVVAAAKVGAVDVDYFERTHLESARKERALKQGPKTQADVMNLVGHRNQETTNLYYDKREG